MVFRRTDSHPGRVQILGGRIFYSPNSTRTVSHPPPDLSTSVDGNIFLPQSASTLPDGRFNAWDLNATDYLQPRFWSRPWGWISFFPLEPHFEQPPFQCLLAAPRRAGHIPKAGARYIMPDDVLNEWLELDRNLTRATSLIQSYYDIPAVRPISPWAFGYPKRHIDRRHMHIAICKGREWFSVWIALFSYIVAQAESIQADLASYPHLAKVNWPEYLVSNGFKWTWIDSIQSSMVCLLTPRTGVFLHLPPS